MAAPTRALLMTSAMNLPLPSGSSPEEKPPQNARIWLSSIRFASVSMEESTSAGVRFLNTYGRTSAPALRKAFAVS